MSRPPAGALTFEAHGPGLGEKLFSDCLGLFSALSQQQSMVARKTDKELFYEELGRFYLWGEGFQDGKLDVILSSAPYLRTAVLKHMVTIGSLLLNSEPGTLSSALQQDD